LQVFYFHGGNCNTYTVIAFEICGDLQREDGIFERKCINGLIPLEIDLDGEWMFEITEVKDWNQYF
jgi:hypothetical protein